MGIYTERIRRGAALLDVEQPGWREYIRETRTAVSA